MNDNGEWGTLCDDGWDLNDARVVCRQLRLGDALLAPQSARFGAGSGQIMYDNFGCSGAENAITDCPNSGLEKHNCGHNEDASVVCDDAGNVMKYNIANNYVDNVLVISKRKV